MNYVLDSDTIIYFLRGNERVVSKIRSIDVDKLCTTVINQAELLYGAYNSNNPNENIKTITGFLSNIAILGFDSNAARVFGKFKSILRAEGQLITDMDLIIGSIVIDRGLTLVSNNTKHFERLKNLKLKNWSA
ncbi:tRNA(fMet)-specific endonuclease VapC [Alphaproteobacteria bacterium]